HGRVSSPAVAIAPAPVATEEEQNIFSAIKLIKLSQSSDKNGASANALKKVVSGGKSLANFTLDLRGFDFSKEGANVILNEKLNAKNEMAREYLQRQALDQKELELCSGIFKLADALHLRSADVVQKREAALLSIQSELGQNEASRLVSELSKLETRVEAKHR